MELPKYMYVLISPWWTLHKENGTYFRIEMMRYSVDFTNQLINLNVLYVISCHM